MLQFSALILYTCLGTLPFETIPSMPAAPIAWQQQNGRERLLLGHWVLREQLRLHNGDLEPQLPEQLMELTLRANHTYTLVQHHQDARSGEPVEQVEEGTWSLRPGSSSISMQVRQVNGEQILTAPMLRWSVEELSERQLILKDIRAGVSLLVFEQDTASKK